MKRSKNIFSTALELKHLKPDFGKVQIEYYDSEVPGLGIRVTRAGTKSWFVVYRYRRRFRRIKLGAYPELNLVEARERARSVRVKVADGVDPGAEKAKWITEARFEQLVDLYLEKHAKPKKKSWKEDKRILEKYFTPYWKRRGVTEIPRIEVIDLVDKIAERGAPIQANKALAVVRKCFNFGIQRGLLEINPCTQVPRPGKERQRERVLNANELKKLIEFLKTDNSDAGFHLLLVLLTAARPGEVREMEWGDVLLGEGWWVIPGEKSKNGLQHRVPLTPSLVSMLRQRKLRCSSSRWVFPGKGTCRPVTSFKRGMNSIRKNTELSFIAKDLRRTASTNMTSLGIPQLIVSKLLSHKEQGVTWIYDRNSYDKEKRKALEQWYQYLCDVEGGVFELDQRMLEMAES